MSTWSSAVLVNHQDWSLSNLLRPDELPAFPLSYAGDTEELGELVDPIPPLVELKPDDAIVRPKDIDRITGSVRVSSVSAYGRGYKVGASEAMLQEGDLLIPFASSLPLIAVSDRHAGLAFSPRFQVIRPNGDASSERLWSVLSAASGGQARRLTESGSLINRPRLSELLRIRIPMDDLWWSRASGEVHEILAQAQVTFLEPPIPSSYWRVSELPAEGERWDVLLARWEGLPEGTVPLRVVCSLIEAGKIDSRNASEVSGPGMAAVMTTSALRRGEGPDRWARSGDIPVSTALAGDVLMTQTPRFRALVLQEPTAASRGTIRLVFDDRGWRDAFVRFVNSNVGQRYLEIFATGSTVPHLNLSTLQALQIPDVRELQFAPAPAPGTQVRLADRLEAVLWL